MFCSIGIVLSGGGVGCVRLLLNCEDSKQEGCGCRERYIDCFENLDVKRQVLIMKKDGWRLIRLQASYPFKMHD